MAERPQGKHQRTASSTSETSQHSHHSQQSQQSSRTLMSQRTEQSRDAQSGAKGKELQIDRDTEEKLRREWTGYAPLPAVKGTMGGIETPRRARHLHSPSISTLRASPAPSHPASPSPNPATHDNPQDNDSNPPPPRRIPNPDAPAFRPDPTVKTCFDTCPLEARDALKSLFLA